ncbi:rod shape-determining protein MreC [Aquimarina sp. AD10]|uniref:rod shape-determining protein MreC n=1 Tax=Aquimarina sp. AD10 TaxID=1714849 RepID=UPI000E52F913|nr:rod shape-determining protein MreC [Aquimarina sp. AD10]AXT61290.1 rod shape-determining protein MreC [Aquimarina sp. AD10]RKN01515.1 rod shape-determining protein MreC [Aquimarina sp. AD10]
MQQIINFLIRNKHSLLFLLLLFLSLVFTIQSHSYHKSKFVSSTNFISGGMYGWQHSISDYFGLKDENMRLLQENEHLRNQLSLLGVDSVTTKHLDTISFKTPYTFTQGRVIKNDYSKIDNYILINKGKKDSIVTDMGVITDKGIIGIVEQTSTNYSRVISILNSNSRINAGLKKSNQYGSLVWNGKDPNIVQLETVPRQAILKKGDTIITHGRSTIFPRGIGIGTIVSYKLDENKSYYLIDVELFNDMTDIGFIYFIKNSDVKEIKQLEAVSNE